MRVPSKWHMLKFDELSGGLPMAWLHRSLKKLENGKYNGEGTLNTITVILPDNFECPCSESLIYRCFESEFVLTAGCPKRTVLADAVTRHDP
jgi:hypothetical protein